MKGRNVKLATFVPFTLKLVFAGGLGGSRRPEPQVLSNEGAP